MAGRGLFTMTRGPDDDGEEELPKDCIAPNGDVFSYFTLASPNELKKHGRFTLDAFMSYLLVFVVLCIQCILLYCVSDKVISKNVSWVNGVMNTGQDWNIMMPASSGCNDGRSMCTFTNGTISCAPPSVALIGRWDELDTDKDGVWTRAEVVKAREDLRCKYAVDPVEVFDVLIGLLKERKKHIWLHDDIKDSKAIHKHYFTYIMGDVAMCGYRNGDMCGNLIKRGFFDAALVHGESPRVGTSVRSALDYCHNLLDQGGFCERYLPSTYSTWKIESVQECKDPEYSQFVYKDPRGAGYPSKSLLQVDYEARQRYEVAQTPIFMMYKTAIIFLWVLLIVSQVREVAKTMAWVVQIPTSDEEEASVPIGARPSLRHQRSEIRNDEVQNLSLRHRLALNLVTAVRIFILCVLLYVGLNFLGRQTDYIGLLLDGVALIFIVDVEQIVYERVLRAEVRNTWEEREPIELTKVGSRIPGLGAFLSSRPDIMDLLWFLVVAFMAIAFLISYTNGLVKPLYAALECACLSEGEKCHEAHAFSYSFWEQYWKHDVPSSIEGINKLMGGLPLNDIKSSFHSVVDHTSRRGLGNLMQTHLQPSL